MKKFFMLCLFASLATIGRAQSDTTMYKHSLGLHAGIASGYGFSYRYWPTKIGLQVTAFPFLSNSEFRISSGLSLLLTIKDFSKLRLYSYLGNHFQYQRFSYGDPMATYSETFNNYTAIGVGVRINFLEVLDFNLQAGYGIGFRQANNSIFNNPQYNTTLDVGAGLYFHF